VVEVWLREKQRPAQRLVDVWTMSNLVDLRGTVPLTRHIHAFDIPLSSSTESDLRNPDKDHLRTKILTMRTDGISYRQIAREVGLHWTRVQQIVKSLDL
jgi:hypothetical protein